MTEYTEDDVADLNSSEHSGSTGVECNCEVGILSPHGSQLLSDTERDRDRQRQRQRETETQGDGGGGGDRHRDRETETDRQTEAEAERERERYRQTQTNKERRDVTAGYTETGSL